MDLPDTQVEYPTYMKIMYPSLNVVKSGRMTPTGLVENGVTPAITDIIDLVFHTPESQYTANLLEIVAGGGGGGGAVCDEYYWGEGGQDGEEIKVLIEYPPPGSILNIYTGLGGQGIAGGTAPQSGRDGESTTMTLFSPGGDTIHIMTARGGAGGSLQRRNILASCALVMLRAVLSIDLSWLNINRRYMNFGVSSPGGEGGISIASISGWEHMYGLEPRRL